jgi:hypothetical protein
LLRLAIAPAPIHRWEVSRGSSSTRQPTQAILK